MLFGYFKSCDYCFDLSKRTIAFEYLADTGKNHPVHFQRPCCRGLIKRALSAKMSSFFELTVN